jgi:purine-binding chemotaxis protein CheW
VSAAHDEKMPWVIAQLGTQLFGLHCSGVREMVISPEVSAVPGVPGYIKGVINLRGRVTPLVDLRLRLGMRSSVEETEALCALMEQRAQDHRRWLEELDASVRERRRFALARDPHQCAFGKWYDNFKTDDILVSGFLKKFDAPHKRIHALADEVQALVESGHSEEARERLDKARNGALAAMLRLFADFQALIREHNREIAVVLNGAGGAYAVSVDSVTSVERLSAADMEELGASGLEQRERLVRSAAKRAKGHELVLTLDADRILDRSVHGLIPAS